MSSVDFEMRRSFAYIDGELKFCPRRAVSNYDWLVKELGLSEEEFGATVHGAHYPGRAYFYKGMKQTFTDEEVESIAEKCRGLFNTETEICCGAIPGKEGDIWEPIKRIGYGTKTKIDENQRPVASVTREGSP